MKLWDRIQRGMEAGFDAATSAVHTITEKAGEGIVIGGNITVTVLEVKGGGIRIGIDAVCTDPLSVRK